MSFVKFLQGIGDRLGILETIVVPGSPPTTRIQTRSVSLRELAGEINTGDIRTLADSPSELSVPFEKIYETAGISANPSDWTIERLKQILASELLSSKPRMEIQKSVLELLKSEGVPVETIVKDAVARDQAMDSYEAFIIDKMQARMGMRRKRLEEIESKVRDLQEESRALEAALAADEGKWREWRRHKRAREQELAALISYVVDHSVITTDGRDEIP
ncbi:MAG: hypothetical protein JXA73_22610 [Acidobacteria bacterium]|nr:hypothetical protein [Acidobacteriota bacterium]